jgi:hypothetical protein
MTTPVPRRIRRRLISILALCTAVNAAVAATPGTAAAANPYTARQVCGAGYQERATYYVTTGSGARWGDLVLMWSASARKNCAVVLKRVYIGTATATHVMLSVNDGDRAMDEGSYRYYAGPIRLSAYQKCVYATGSVANTAESTKAWGETEGLVLCG